MPLNAKRFAIAAAPLLTAAFWPDPASAACSAPAGIEGEMRYFSGDQAYKYCDGADWSPMGGSMPAGAIAAFEQSSCPAGWAAYTPAEGRFVVGAGSYASGADADGANPATSYAAGDTGGTMDEVMTEAEMPSHDHRFDVNGYSATTLDYLLWNDPNSGNSNRIARSSSGSSEGRINIAPAGGDAAQENRPPYVALTWCEKQLDVDAVAGSSIDGLADVDTTSETPSTGATLVWDGANWTPSTDSSGTDVLLDGRRAVITNTYSGDPAAQIKIGKASYSMHAVTVAEPDDDGDVPYYGMHRGGGTAWQIGLLGNDFTIANGGGSSTEDLFPKKYFTIDTGGNVGVGTVSPQDKLDVNGGMLVGNIWGHDTIQFANRELSNYSGNRDDSGASADQTGVGLVWYDRSNGGTPSLFLCGQGTSWELDTVSASAKRFKKDVRDLDVDLDRLLDLHPVTFEWKDKKGWEGKRDVGLIAEDVADTFPKLVTRKNGEVFGVRYDRMNAYLLAGMRDLDDRYAERVDSLEKRVAELEAGDRGMPVAALGLVGAALAAFGLGYAAARRSGPLRRSNSQR